MQVSLLWSLLHLFHFIIQLTALCSARPERLTASPPLGAKYFGWLCADPRLLTIKHQRSSVFTLLLISRSYWFDKSRFIIEGKLLLAISTPSLGAPPNSSSVAISDAHDADVMMMQKGKQEKSNLGKNPGHYNLFHYIINRFVFCETGKIDKLFAVGGKVFWLSLCRSASVEGQAPDIFNIHLVVDFKVLLVR